MQLLCAALRGGLLGRSSAAARRVAAGGAGQQLRRGHRGHACLLRTARRGGLVQLSRAPQRGVHLSLPRRHRTPQPRHASLRAHARSVAGLLRCCQRALVWRLCCCAAHLRHAQS
jgi:hypothetical protein